MICPNVQVTGSHARIRSCLGFSGSIAAVSSGDSILRGAALLLLIGGCARPTEVELRLFPCGLAGATPVSVELDVQGYDADGAALSPLNASFAVAAEVLGDGYATVGLRPPATMASADFTLTWRDAKGAAEVVTHAARAVPALGEVLELGAEMCAPLDATSSSGEGTSTSTGTSGGTSTSSGEGTSTSTSTSTGEGTSTSTGESTSTSTSTGETTESSTTGEPSMVGDGCNMAVDQYFCEHGGPGQLGTLLECVGATWTEAKLEQRCNLNDFCPPNLGLVEPKAVGCSGEGAIGWACVCQDKQPQACDGDEAACVGIQRIDLCIDDGEGTLVRTRGLCTVLCLDVDIAGPQCSA